MATRPDVIVIGAGHNGLTTAALLAKAGRSVLVLERRDVVGGLAASEEFHPGYRSAGLLHDTSCLRHDVVAALGLETHGLVLTPSPPPVFVPQSDGSGLLLHHDARGAALEITAHSDHDAARYDEFRAFLRRVGAVVDDLFAQSPLDRVFDGDGGGGVVDLIKSGLRLRRLGRRDMMEILRVMPMSVSDWLGEWFDHELLRAALAAPAIHGTFSGPRAPGSNANLLRVESLRGPVVRGGPQSLIAALEAAARAGGAEIRTGADVRRIRVADGRVEGVELSDGEFVDSAVVAASCDPHHTFLELVGGHDITPMLAGRIRGFRMRGTTAAMHLALDAPLRFACRPDLAVEHARIGEHLDDLERAADAVKYGRFPDRPIMEIHVPTVADPRMAPEGHCVVTVLARFVPYHLADGWGDKQRRRLEKTMMKILKRYAPSLDGSVVARETLTPADIESRYHVTGGHLDHGEHGLDQMLIRPCPECAGHATPLRGLYLCGSGSAPGGGLTCGPGAMAASAITAGRGR